MSVTTTSRLLLTMTTSLLVMTTCSLSITESDKYRRVDAVMGDTLVLGCSTTQSSGVDWTQNSSYVYVNGTITGHRNILIQFSVVNTSEGVNSLRIYNVHPVYSGWYDCYETDGRRIIGYHVVATKAPDRYYYRTAKVGQTVKFPCLSKLKEDVDWARLDTLDSMSEDIYLGNLGMYDNWHDRRFTVTERNHSYTLTIRNVTVGDSAYYRCVEDSGFGRRHFHRLAVQDTPVHSRRDTPVHSRRDVVVGESVELVCNTSLTPDIMWTYDTDDGYVDYVYWNAHSHKPRIAVKFIAVGFHSLVVSDAQLNDSGLYGCYDGKGTRKVGYQLTVAGRTTQLTMKAGAETEETEAADVETPRAALIASTVIISFIIIIITVGVVCLFLLCRRKRADSPQGATKELQQLNSPPIMEAGLMLSIDHNVATDTRHAPSLDELPLTVLKTVMLRSLSQFTARDSRIKQHWTTLASLSASCRHAVTELEIWRHIKRGYCRHIRPTLKQIIGDNFSRLRRSMDPSFDLLATLRSVPFVRDRISSITRQITDDQKNDTLLNVLCEVPDDIQESIMNGFVSAVRSSGQDHVANVFYRTSDKVLMSDEHRETLLAKLDELQKFTDTENGLFDRLVSHGVVSMGDTERIRSVKDQNGMAQKLVEILLRKSDEAFNQFITVLNETGQAHVAYILTGEGDRRPLKEEHRRRLLSGPREDLVNMMDSKQSGLITALMSKDVFSVYDQQRVISVQPDTVCDRNELILNLIARKSQTDFFNFISALNDTGQTHVVAALLGADVVAKVMTAYESESHMPEVDAELLEYMRDMFQNYGDILKRIK